MPENRAFGADHGDAPSMGMIQRQDAMITDLFAFRNGDNLVLALCTNPMIPPTVTSYTFPRDLTLTFHIDTHSAVRFNDADDMITYGGTIAHPAGVRPNITIEVNFKVPIRPPGYPVTPQVKARGLRGPGRDDIEVFAGLRDDPFIRWPRRGRNVAAVVLELPLSAVRARPRPMLIWATTHVPEVGGPMAEHGGRALRSMFVEPSNTMTPAEHWTTLGMVPDVIIYDPRIDAIFPNGRAPSDDVVDMVVDIPTPDGTLPGEDPGYPTENDVPFLDEFPYLAPPHLP
jgi:hypothetical protein